MRTKNNTMDLLLIDNPTIRCNDPQAGYSFNLIAKDAV